MCLMLLPLHNLDLHQNSENRPQSKKQQQFNNRLVSIIHHTATSNGWTFDPDCFGGERNSKKSAKISKSSKGMPPPPDFNYKKLRDRIRCYYKTHVQNSKKRLITLLKNPTKPKNREVLFRIMKEIASEDGVGLEGGNLPSSLEAEETMSETPSERTRMDCQVGEAPVDHGTSAECDENAEDRITTISPSNTFTSHAPA